MKYIYKNINVIHINNWNLNAIMMQLHKVLAEHNFIKGCLILILMGKENTN